eukprot:gene40030-3709_t
MGSSSQRVDDVGDVAVVGQGGVTGAGEMIVAYVVAKPIARKLLRSVAHVQENAAMHIDDVVRRLEAAGSGEGSPLTPVTPGAGGAAWAPRARAIFEAIDVSNTGSVSKHELGALLGVPDAGWRRATGSPTARRVDRLMSALDREHPGSPRSGRAELDLQQWLRFVRGMDESRRDAFLLKCQSIIAALQRQGVVRRLALPSAPPASAFD